MTNIKEIICFFISMLLINSTAFCQEPKLDFIYKRESFLFDNTVPVVTFYSYSSPNTPWIRVNSKNKTVMIWCNKYRPAKSEYNIDTCDEIGKVEVKEIK